MVTLSANPGREVIIPITATNRGGATAADYLGVPSSLTFGSDDSWKMIRFRAASDSEDDGESVDLGFGATLPAGVSIGRDASTTVWIHDGERVHLGLPQVGIGVTAAVSDDTASNVAWQWQRSATETGTYADIPADKGGTTNPYTPSEDDLGMWLKAKVTYDAGSETGKTSQGIARQPVLAQPVVSNAGYNNTLLKGFVKDIPATYNFAQGFTTGPDTRGYQLTGVRLGLYGGAFLGGTWAGTWGVHADSAGKPAAEPLATALPILNEELAEDSETLVGLTLPNGMRLSPNTKYWIVISRTTSWHEGVAVVGPLADFGNSLPVQEGSSTPYADPGSKDGWSIDLEALAYHWNNRTHSFEGNPTPHCIPGIR